MTKKFHEKGTKFFKFCPLVGGLDFVLWRELLYINMFCMKIKKNYKQHLTTTFKLHKKKFMGSFEHNLFVQDSKNTCTQVFVTSSQGSKLLAFSESQGGETEQFVENQTIKGGGAEDNSQNARVLVITSGKGGVGKTTATANLGMSMARLGYRIALIDADIGLRNLDLLLGLENRVLYTAMDILEGQCRLDQALIRDKRWKNLSLLAISKNRQRYNVTRKNMENLVNSIISLGYQFILIDCPAGIDVGFINAISPAQEAVIVTTPEITAIRDADRVAGLLEANGIYNVKLLVNRVRPDMIQKNDMMSVKDVQEMLGIPLLGAIPEDNHVIISTNRGEPLVLNKKLTLSGIAFENAARRLIGKQDYFLDLATPYKGVFQKVQEFFLGIEK
jgi:septum site-determining protein MinD